VKVPNDSRTRLQQMGSEPPLGEPNGTRRAAEILVCTNDGDHLPGVSPHRCNPGPVLARPGLFLVDVCPMLIVFKGIRNACLNRFSLFKVNLESKLRPSLVGWGGVAKAQ
jgi:hypothetical protein